ncbi:hypothetical protein [Duganella qianjiadongensis]|nr:hypothetical protein [Duganella qianjiadongensis]
MMRLRRLQRGIALPIMLIMLTVMLVSSIYLLKSSTSTTLTTSNLAYESALSKAADLGVHTAFAYLRDIPNKAQLESNQAAAGYVASMSPTWTVSTPAFWQGSLTLPPDAAGNRVEYVIHRLCDFAGPYNAVNNRCQLTSARPNSKTSQPYGRSGRSDSPNYLDQPQLHYVVTARIAGARGGNVVTQAVIMKGP